MDVAAIRGVDMVDKMKPWTGVVIVITGGLLFGVGNSLQALFVIIVVVRLIAATVALYDKLAGVIKGVAKVAAISKGLLDKVAVVIIAIAGGLSVGVGMSDELACIIIA